ncbi:hypothetical protein PoB_007388900 [Plakobranchus ocellatus]|uniref:Uncharacterized protein n=1 Tax=Plakobranchus ocellatus TaxID=259542 RepID=A0AAV4DTR6_9GAST|nr:hypothetical protein PoB_007388900 [Plakobranchus ocellatus]
MSYLRVVKILFCETLKPLASEHVYMKDMPRSRWSHCRFQDTARQTTMKRYIEKPAHPSKRIHRDEAVISEANRQVEQIENKISTGSGKGDEGRVRKG